MDQFEELFQKYNCDLQDNEVQQQVDRLLADHFSENNTPAVYANCLSLIDLTSLNGTDTEEQIVAMTQKVNDFKTHFPNLPNVGAICVYPSMVPVVKKNLVPKIGIASVAAGFPASQTFIEVKIAETSMAVMEGASEIDVVIARGVAGN